MRCSWANWVCEFFRTNTRTDCAWQKFSRTPRTELAPDISLEVSTGSRRKLRERMRKSNTWCYLKITSSFAWVVKSWLIIRTLLAVWHSTTGIYLGRIHCLNVWDWILTCNVWSLKRNRTMRKNIGCERWRRCFHAGDRQRHNKRGYFLIEYRNWRTNRDYDNEICFWPEIAY